MTLAVDRVVKPQHKQTKTFIIDMHNHVKKLCNGITEDIKNRKRTENRDFATKKQ